MRTLLIAAAIASQAACSPSEPGDAAVMDTGNDLAAETAAGDIFDSGYTALPDTIRWSLRGVLQTGALGELQATSSMELMLYLQDEDTCIQPMLLQHEPTPTPDPTEQAVGWWIDLQSAPADTMGACSNVAATRVWVGLAPFTPDLLPYVQPLGLVADDLLTLLVRTEPEGTTWLVGAARPQSTTDVDLDDLTITASTVELFPVFSLAGHP